MKTAVGTGDNPERRDGTKGAYVKKPSTKSSLIPKGKYEKKDYQGQEPSKESPLVGKKLKPGSIKTPYTPLKREEDYYKSNPYEKNVNPYEQDIKKHYEKTVKDMKPERPGNPYSMPYDGQVLEKKTVSKIKAKIRGGMGAGRGDNANTYKDPYSGEY